MLWCLGLEGISRKVHLTALVEVTAGTVVEFVTNDLAENGRRIKIKGQLSVNNSIQFLCLSNQSWESGFPIICNLMAHVEATGWESGNYSNQGWGGRFNNANIITNDSWVDSVSPCPDNGTGQDRKSVVSHYYS